MQFVNVVFVSLLQNDVDKICNNGEAKRVNQLRAVYEDVHITTDHEMSAHIL